MKENDKKNEQEHRRDRLRRVVALVQFTVALLVVGFGTWQLFLGNLEAAFSTMPFLVIWYLFLMYGRRR
jgi:hypothetical protein